MILFMYVLYYSITYFVFFLKGFGLFGHAQNLASVQRQPLSFSIHTLPVIAHTADISRACTVRKFKLLEGLDSETSGSQTLFKAFKLASIKQICKIV